MNESGTGKETSISEILTNFERIAFALEARHGGCIQLARIKGSRWSYLAGTLVRDTPSGPPRRIRLNDGFGLVVYPGEKNTLQENELFRLFERLLNG